jgi:hemoglobin-like flavoprotein
MNDWKILAVKNSWSYLLLDSEEAGALFYQKLFELDPSLEPLFKHVMPTQAKKLVDMLTLMIANLQSMGNITEEVSALAKRHVHYGTQPGHYQTVGTALLYTLEIQLEDRWNEDIRQAWIEVYDQWAKAMIEAS